MTRNAIIDVAIDLLTDNPNPSSEGSSQRISTLQGSSPSEKDIVTAYYGEMQRGATRNFVNVIEAIQEANSDVDLGPERRLAEAHFDGETFQAGHNRLSQLRQMITSQILVENFAVARRETGRLLHTLQDFYSHSNWIELGYRYPYSVLGRASERGPGNVASPRRQTCDDCRVGGTVLVGLFSSFFTQASRNYYACQENIIQDGGILTSGYHAGQIDNNGRVIEKPWGKCSHGGFLDATSDMPARGGINKDSPFEQWSPHHYYYDEAASVARQATFDMLQEIRRDVDDDQLFGEFLGLTLNEASEAASIAYVIDTTGSMAEELPEIQATIPEIRASLQQYADSFSGNIQVRYILVPFNDPGGLINCYQIN